eukprot:8702569-Alexandrium_andersonii.AAC.1
MSPTRAASSSSPVGSTGGGATATTSGAATKYPNYNTHGAVRGNVQFEWVRIGEQSLSGLRGLG